MDYKHLQLPSLSALQAFLAYDADKGGFVYTQRRRGRGRIMPGDTAGVVQPSGYRTIMIDKHRHYIHRLVWYWHHGDLPELPNIVVHINDDPSDNRIENLKVMDRTEYRMQRNEVHQAQMEMDAQDYVS